MKEAAILQPVRKKEIVDQYLSALDHHIAELKAGKVERALEIRDFANQLFIHPTHLANTVREVTGRSTCSHYEERLVRISSELLLDTSLPISEIAMRLTYDPSNFTKFFKHFTGVTPKQFRTDRPSSLPLSPPTGE